MIGNATSTCEISKAIFYLNRAKKCGYFNNLEP